MTAPHDQGHPIDMRAAALDTLFPDWRTSSYSSGGGNCVKVGIASVVGIRDSKDHQQTTLVIDRKGWRAFIAHTKGGMFTPA